VIFVNARLHSSVHLTLDMIIGLQCSMKLGTAAEKGAQSEGSTSSARMHPHETMSTSPTHIQAREERMTSVCQTRAHHLNAAS